MLDSGTISEIVATAVEEELFNRRDRMLWNVAPRIVAGLRTSVIQDEQLLFDVTALNKLDMEIESSVPLVQWLSNAAAVTQNPSTHEQFKAWAVKADCLRRDRQTPLRPRAPDPRNLPVLLARVADDMAPQRETLRKTLVSLGVRVLPADEFSEDEAQFRGEFLSLLDEKPIVVQLLGRMAAERTAAMPEGFDAFQTRAAREAGRTLMQWRDILLTRHDVADAEHGELVFHPDVESTGFNDFTGLVARRAREPALRPAPTAEFVYIDADLVDEAKARGVFQQLDQLYRASGIPRFVRLRNLTGKASAIRQNYQGACKVALIQENAHNEWLNAKLDFYTQAATKRVRDDGCVIYRGPPPPKSGNDVYVAHGEFCYVYSADGSIDGLIARLR